MFDRRGEDHPPRGVAGRAEQRERVRLGAARGEHHVGGGHAQHGGHGIPRVVQPAARDHAGAMHARRVPEGQVERRGERLPRLAAQRRARGVVEVATGGVGVRRVQHDGASSRR
jgi:hypothetical protein